MRQPRFISPFSEDHSSTYHCVSRVVDRKFVMGEEEKDVFVGMMRDYEAFCDVQVLSYCVMSNHFHILVEVPPKVKGEAVAMSDVVFLQKMKAMYSAVYYRDVEQMLERFRTGGSDTGAEELKAKYSSRMHDLSEFMKGLKQRFTQWYNGKHGRRGTLWEGRFKSVLVENGYAARVMAAYIDLNPIRAGMVTKPEDYKWCSYGEAMLPANKTGNRKARAGLSRVLVQCDHYDQQRNDGELVSWKKGGAERYRVLLFTDGEEVFVDDIHTAKESAGVDLKRLEDSSARVKKGFKRADVEKVLAKGGKLSFGEALRCKVRYFSDGMSFGSQKFLNDVFGEERERFGASRKSGARPLRNIGWKKKDAKLYSMRALVKGVIK